MTTITRNLLTVDVANHNGRIYSREVVQKMIDDFNKMKANNGIVHGELEQPRVGSNAINLDRISHSVDGLYLEGNNLMATVSILSTPMGTILETLNSDIPDSLDLALRGSGVVHPTRYISDYNFLTVDVCNVSHPTDDTATKLDEILKSMEKDGLL